LVREIAPEASSCWIFAAMSSDESIGAKRTRAMCAAMRNTAEVRAMAVVAARCCRFARSIHAAAGPLAKVMRASTAGRRSAAKLGPVRSKRLDMERV
jgi:hypothetical protein